MSIGEQMDMYNFGAGPRSVARINEALGGYFDRRDRQQDIEENRRYVDATQDKRYQQALELQDVRMRQGQETAREQARLASDRDKQATIMKLVANGYKYDPKISMEENLASAYQQAEAKQQKEVKGAAANLRRFDEVDSELAKQAERLDVGYRVALADTARKAFEAQLDADPELRKKLDKALAKENLKAGKGPGQFQEAYVQQRRDAIIAGLTGVSLQSVQEEIAALEDHPLNVARKSRERALTTEIAGNQTARNRFLQYDKNAQAALSLNYEKDTEDRNRRKIDEAGMFTNALLGDLSGEGGELSPREPDPEMNPTLGDLRMAEQEMAVPEVNPALGDLRMAEQSMMAMPEPSPMSFGNFFDSGGPPVAARVRPADMFMRGDADSPTTSAEALNAPAARLLRTLRQRLQPNAPLQEMPDRQTQATIRNILSNPARASVDPRLAVDALKLMDQIDEATSLRNEVGSARPKRYLSYADQEISAALGREALPVNAQFEPLNSDRQWRSREEYLNADPMGWRAMDRSMRTP